MTNKQKTIMTILGVLGIVIMSLCTSLIITYIYHTNLFGQICVLLICTVIFLVMAFIVLTYSIMLSIFLKEW